MQYSKTLLLSAVGLAGLVSAAPEKNFNTVNVVSKKVASSLSFSPLTHISYLSISCQADLEKYFSNIDPSVMLKRSQPEQADFVDVNSKRSHQDLLDLDVNLAKLLNLNIDVSKRSSGLNLDLNLAKILGLDVDLTNKGLKVDGKLGKSSLNLGVKAKRDLDLDVQLGKLLNLDLNAKRSQSSHQDLLDLDVQLGRLLNLDANLKRSLSLDLDIGRLLGLNAQLNQKGLDVNGKLGKSKINLDVKAKRDLELDLNLAKLLNLDLNIKRSEPTNEDLFELGANLGKILNLDVRV